MFSHLLSLFTCSYSFTNECESQLFLFYFFVATPRSFFSPKATFTYFYCCVYTPKRVLSNIMVLAHVPVMEQGPNSDSEQCNFHLF